MKNPHTGQAYSAADLARCPHMASKKIVEDSPFKEKITMNNDSEPNSATKETKTETPSPSGGCPVMNIDDSKRNPGYFIPEVSFQVPYVSPFSEYLNCPKEEEQNSPNWAEYPNYLRDSICLYGPEYDKYRKLEVGYKFFVTDEIKEVGNKFFREKEYEKAMLEYSKAASIMRWLEVDDSKQKSLFDQLEEIKRGTGPDTDETSSNDESKEIKNEKPKEKKTQKSNDELFAEKITRLVFTRMTDENVKLIDGHDLRNASDKEMHDNLVFSLGLNIIACYIMLQDYEQARKTAAECEKINGNSSLFLYRKAQTIFANAESTISELETARSCLITAIENKKTEKIFEHHPRFLRMFGLEDHETAFPIFIQKVEGKINEIKKSRRESIRVVFTRVAEIQDAEKNIISRGLTPKDGPERTFFTLSKNPEVEKKMFAKLLSLHQKAISFYRNDDKKERYEYSKQAYVNVRKTIAEFNAFWNLALTSEQSLQSAEVLTLAREFEIDLLNEKARKRIERVQREYARDTLDRANMDFEAFSFVIKELAEEEKDDQKKTKTTEEGSTEEESQRMMTEGKGGMNWMFLSAVLLMALALAARYWLKLF